MSEIINVPELFGSDVFNEAVMKERLAQDVYSAWKKCVTTGSQLPLDAANQIAEPNIALNTIMAEELSRFADVLENADDFDAALHDLVCKAFTDHQRILFGGNGYSDERKEEAARRGLSNLSSTAACLPAMVSDKNIDLVVRHGIYTETEFRARYAIHLEAYNKNVGIEARTMVDMAVHQILPAALRYTRDLCETVQSKQAVGAPHRAESALIATMSENTDKLYQEVESLKDRLSHIPTETAAAAMYYLETVIPCMNSLREVADILESITDKSYWPYPTYSDLLYY